MKLLIKLFSTLKSVPGDDKSVWMIYYMVFSQEQWFRGSFWKVLEMVSLTISCSRSGIPWHRPLGQWGPTTQGVAVMGGNSFHGWGPQGQDIQVQSMVPIEHRDILCHQTVKKIIDQTIHRKSGTIWMLWSRQRTKASCSLPLRKWGEDERQQTQKSGLCTPSWGPHCFHLLPGHSVVSAPCFHTQSYPTAPAHSWKLGSESARAGSLWPLCPQDLGTAQVLSTCANISQG